MKFITVLLLMLPAAAFAADSVLPGPKLSEVAISLSGILVVIVVLAWGVRRLRFAQSLGGSGGGIKIVTAIPVGARDRIVLLEVGEQQLLVGMSPGRMQTLHVLEKPLHGETLATPASGFASKLREVMGGRKP